MARFQLDEGAGRLTPFFSSLRDDRNSRHRRMAVEHVLDFDRGDVLSPGDDDVLGAILELNVAIRVNDTQVAAVKPSAGKGFIGSPRVLIVSLHHRIAAQEDLADGFAIMRDRLHRLGIGDYETFHDRISHSLTRFQLGLLLESAAAPFIMPRTDDARAVDFRQAVDVGYLYALLLHTRQNRGRW